MPVPRYADGGITLSCPKQGLPTLLQLTRRHNSQGRLLANNAAALACIRWWLTAWPETESGQRWAQPPGQAGSQEGN